MEQTLIDIRRAIINHGDDSLQHSLLLTFIRLQVERALAAQGHELDPSEGRPF